MAKQKKSEQACIQCGCTDTNCKTCIEKTDEPCFWVEKDLCSACAFKDLWPELQPLKTKGERLGFLLGVTSKLSLEMEKIFIDNNVNHLDLKALPEEALQRWRALLKRDTQIGSLMANIING